MIQFEYFCKWVAQPPTKLTFCWRHVEGIWWRDTAQISQNHVNFATCSCHVLHVRLNRMCIHWLVTYSIWNPFESRSRILQPKYVWGLFDMAISPKGVLSCLWNTYLSGPISNVKRQTWSEESLSMYPLIIHQGIQTRTPFEKSFTSGSSHP